ncbi:MAG: lamin tail domain-containing protein, partial [Caldilineaceae bacterium]|nr:lamin tail domain-containing protein [Caldilineaceae bacterium]
MRNRKSKDRKFQQEQLEPRTLLAADVLISEFSASNDTVLRDDDRDYPDWIELYNVGDEAADLTGWYLTDDANLPTKWTFPSGTVAPGEFLTLFASGKDFIDGDGALHTNFNLAKQG